MSPDPEDRSPEAFEAKTQPPEAPGRGALGSDEFEEPTPTLGLTPPEAAPEPVTDALAVVTPPRPPVRKTAETAVSGTAASGTAATGNRPPDALEEITQPIALPS